MRNLLSFHPPDQTAGLYHDLPYMPEYPDTVFLDETSEPGDMVMLLMVFIVEMASASAKNAPVATIAMWMVDSDSGFNYMLISICGTIPSIIF